jgi:catechol 2,3-dioxygenase-like lactoylglutathione lyase family enzyme
LIILEPLTPGGGNAPMAMFSNAHMVSLIPIRKMDRAIRFYTGKLGAKLVNRAPGAMKNYWAQVRLGKVDVWFVAPQKLEKRNLSYHTFLVKNIRSAVKGLQKKGVKFEKGEKTPTSTSVEGPITWEPFGGGAFFKDPEGNLLMVWQNVPPM